MAKDSLQRRDRLKSADKPRLVLLDLDEETQVNPDYQGVGAVLRAQRRQSGLSLEDVATQIRIRHPYLKALEAGDFASLPGRSYAIGFIRSYAEFLGLDGIEATEAFKREPGPAPADAKLVFPVPAAETRTPRLWLILVAVIVAALVYAWWYGRQQALLTARIEVPAVPERLAELPAPAPAADPPKPPVAEAPAAVPPPVAVQTVQPPPPVASPSPAPPPVPAAAAPAPRQPGLYGAESGSRLQLRALQTTWVRVYTTAGQTLFQRVLEPGEIYRVPNQPDLLLHAGNLGGLEVSAEGKIMPPLGLPGVAKSNIPLLTARPAEPAAGSN